LISLAERQASELKPAVRDEHAVAEFGSVTNITAFFCINRPRENSSFYVIRRAYG